MDSPSTPKESVTLLDINVGNVVKNWKPANEKLKARQEKTPMARAISERPSATRRTALIFVSGSACRTISPRLRIKRISGIEKEKFTAMLFAPSSVDG